MNWGGCLASRAEGGGVGPAISCAGCTAQGRLLMRCFLPPWRSNIYELVTAALDTPAGKGWSLVDPDQVRLSAQISTELQAYGDAIIDPREYPRDSAECGFVSTMAAAADKLPPEGGQAGGDRALVQAVNLYEGEDEFAGE